MMTRKTMKRGVLLSGKECRLFGIVLLLVPLVLACSGESKAERPTSKEAEEIRKFSSQNQRLEGEHKTLLEAWKGLGTAETQEAFLDEIKISVLPALRNYVGHLNEVRTTSKELSSVHFRLIEGYKKLEEELAAFAQEGQKMDKDQAKKKLSRMFQRTRDIEEVYWQDIQNIYNHHGFQLSQTGQAQE